MINKIFVFLVIEQFIFVFFCCQFDDLDLIVVDYLQVKVFFVLQGVYFFFWKFVGEEEVLWFSNNMFFKIGVVLCGGVLICWFWFGFVV